MNPSTTEANAFSLNVCVLQCLLDKNDRETVANLEEDEGGMSSMLLPK